ncbi:hypothetical protein H0H87_003930 [Tephrocybe sp. NHM501043]|nr:hypothetical protein H0H87_003930 [Tephrocybe sp. NHM501043]
MLNGFPPAPSNPTFSFIVDMAETAGFGGTLTSGIQEISAILPLLGTAECEEHVGSALSHGYLYAAATPMSVFGTLGVVKAGVKALMTSVSFPRLGMMGAKKLDDAGFKPSGKSLSLIMMDPGNPQRHLAETRFDAVLKSGQMETLRVEDLHRLKIVATSAGWNVKLVLFTALSSMVGITPYIFLNLRAGHHLSPALRWIFPAIRVVGGFLAATTIQFIIERRLLAILQHRLVFHALMNGNEWNDLHSFTWWNLDCSSELSILKLRQLLSDTTHKSTFRMFLRKLLRLPLPNAPPTTPFPVDTEPGRNDPPSTPLTPATPLVSPVLSQRSRQKLQTELLLAGWLLHNGDSRMLSGILGVAMVLGIIGSVVGYVGSFSVVQSASPSDTIAPVTWLLVEGFLSVLRMALWGWNPEKDDSEPMKFIIELESNPPFPTCDRSSQEIMSKRILPLTPAPMFLRSIRSYIGYLEPLVFTDMTVYYTLTRRSLRPEGLKRHALFVTLVDHREGITAVYFQDDEGHMEYISATPPDPTSDTLQVEILDRLEVAQFPTMNRFGRLHTLEAHYRDIVRALRSRRKSLSKFASQIKMNWMLIDASSSPPTMAPLPERCRPSDMTDVHEYFSLGALQRRRNEQLSIKRRWLEHYMSQLRVVVQYQLDRWMAVAPRHLVYTIHDLSQLIRIRDCSLILEFFELELLFLKEVCVWENRLLQDRRLLMDQLSSRGGHSSRGSFLHHLKETWTRLASERFKTDQSAAALRVSRVRETLSEDSYDQRIMWSALETALRQDWEGFAEDWRNDRKYTRPRQLLSTLSRYRQPQGLLELVPPICTFLWRFWSNQRSHRLRNEKEDMDKIILTLTSPVIRSDNFADARDLSLPQAHLTSSRVRWASLRESHLHNNDLDSLVETLKRNKDLSVIQFEGEWNDQILATTARNLLPKIPTLSTIILHRPASYPETVSLFQDMVQYTSTATWSEPLGDIPATLEVFTMKPNGGASAPDNGTSLEFPPVSFHFRGFLVQEEREPVSCSCLTMCEGVSWILVQFWGPNDGNLLYLMLQHGVFWSTTSSSAVIEVEINGVHHAFVTLYPNQVQHDVLAFRPQTNFRQNEWNLVTITLVLGSDQYGLFDLDLLNHHGIPLDSDGRVQSTVRQEDGEDAINGTAQLVMPEAQTSHAGHSPENSPGIQFAPLSTPRPGMNVRWDAGSINANSEHFMTPPTPAQGSFIESTPHHNAVELEEDVTTSPPDHQAIQLSSLPSHHSGQTLATTTSQNMNAPDWQQDASRPRPQWHPPLVHPEHNGGLPVYAGGPGPRLWGPIDEATVPIQMQPAAVEGRNSAYTNPIYFRSIKGIHPSLLPNFPPTKIGLQKSKGQIRNTMGGARLSSSMNTSPQSLAGRGSYQFTIPPAPQPEPTSLPAETDINEEDETSNGHYISHQHEGTQHSLLTVSPRRWSTGQHDNEYHISALETADEAEARAGFRQYVHAFYGIVENGTADPLSPVSLPMITASLPLDFNSEEPPLWPSPTPRNMQPLADGPPEWQPPLQYPTEMPLSEYTQHVWQDHVERGNRYMEGVRRETSTSGSRRIDTARDHLPIRGSSPWREHSEVSPSLHRHSLQHETTEWTASGRRRSHDSNIGISAEMVYRPEEDSRADHSNSARQSMNTHRSRSNSWYSTREDPGSSSRLDREQSRHIHDLQPGGNSLSQRLTPQERAPTAPRTSTEVYSYGGSDHEHEAFRLTQEQGSDMGESSGRGEANILSPLQALSSPLPAPSYYPYSPPPYFPVELNRHDYDPSSDDQRSPLDPETLESANQIEHISLIDFASEGTLESIDIRIEEASIPDSASEGDVEVGPATVAVAYNLNVDYEVATARRRRRTREQRESLSEDEYGILRRPPM